MYRICVARAQQVTPTEDEQRGAGSAVVGTEIRVSLGYDEDR